ncbi:ABC transporter permease [Ruegeria pomeroyi]|jgi:peptide/nickel transport system permease protein|uniref:Oligopeptide ABC transporter, permease protein n=2 Tax=Ruegeria pomeroyi TaxID=89184 RepID=Q5LVY5_RUEPO|nr:ABC transporter permease [Ruegeria pomeroyi]HCE72697.1 ABC transporter permease [Ruegeria sp.]AAV93875.1 oligopeptide ABC transporter, permease protein [Ruegeria pomeroyi DSS-3]NVK95427.1 ABC transporter permease [Ruegeria pomeroyi]NVL00503.1 ABC transporter permease [Ruegeria pomeroyi]QWV07463.1 ABC transporter permease [Ruegeria pomeroyi]
MAILRYAFYRFGTMLMTLLVVSVLVFAIINLPPGDYLSNQIAELKASGQSAGVAKAEFLRKEYALDRPVWQQYMIWMGFMPGPHGFSGLIQGNFGWSFEFDRPVSEIVGDSLWLTVLVNMAAIVFVYATALPLGVIAAAKARTWADYTSAFVGYLGLATPNFLLALILYYYGRKYLDIPIGGLMDPAFEGQPMSWAKIQSVLVHLIVPTIVIGTAGASAMMQRLRANMLDELGKPYVETAIAKGMAPSRMLAKYPLRVAFNPFVADIGNLLPSMVSGSVLVSVVMGLQTIGPTLLTALKSQDMFLSGFVLMFVALLTLIGTMISDILLVMLDPRIRYEGRDA